MVSYRSREASLLLFWSGTFLAATWQHWRKRRLIKAQQQLNLEQSQKSETSTSQQGSTALRSVLALLRKRKPLTRGIALAAALCVRLLVSIKVSVLIGKLGSHLSSRRWSKLRQAQVDFALWTIPAAVLNGLVDFCVRQLALACRSTLVEVVHDAYENGETRRDVAGADPGMESSTSVNGNAEKVESEGSGEEEFYGGLSGLSRRVKNADQVATEDVEKLSTDLATVFLSIVKPVAETTILTAALAKMMGVKQVLLCYGYFYFAGTWSRTVTPALTSLSSRVQECEADYRSQHGRVMEHAEEIDFLRGGAAEAGFLRDRFAALETSTSLFDLQRFLSSALDGYVVRYMGILASLAMMSPTLSISGRQRVQDPTQFFLTCFHLLVNLMGAFKDVATAFRTLRTSKGLARRVMELHNNLPSLALAETGTESNSNSTKAVVMKDITLTVPFASDREDTVLLKGLDLAVHEQESLFVKGPNGIGKTSLFRLLSGIWAPTEGQVSMPPRDDCYFLGNKPYIIPGLSLKEQILYPFTPRMMAASEKEIAAVLEAVGMANATGSDQFSTGEAQRIGCARLLLYRPQFAFVDEGTSSCTEEFEAWFFQHCIDTLKITLVSISHREVGRKYHDRTLVFKANRTVELIDNLRLP